MDDYNAIKNDYVDGLEEKLESLSSDSRLINLKEVMIVMDNHPLFSKLPELKTRFWDMFVIDAFIGNNDRNNGNWGVLVNNITGKTTVCPVFDNGASFHTKSSDEQLEQILKDEERFESSAYKSRMCIFRENNKQINPFTYIESIKRQECNDAILRVVPKIDMNKIKKIIYGIPMMFEGMEVISDVRKEYYYKCLDYRYEKSLYPTYQKLLKENRQYSAV